MAHTGSKNPKYQENITAVESRKPHKEIDSSR